MKVCISGKVDQNGPRSRCGVVLVYLATNVIIFSTNASNILSTRILLANFSAPTFLLEIFFVAENIASICFADKNIAKKVVDLTKNSVGNISNVWNYMFSLYFWKRCVKLPIKKMKFLKESFEKNGKKMLKHDHFNV